MSAISFCKREPAGGSARHLAPGKLKTNLWPYIQHFKPHSLLQRQLNLSHSPSQHAIKFCFKGGEKRGKKASKSN